MTDRHFTVGQVVWTCEQPYEGSATDKSGKPARPHEVKILEVAFDGERLRCDMDHIYRKPESFHAARLEALRVYVRLLWEEWDRLEDKMRAVDDEEDWVDSELETMLNLEDKERIANAS